jgi:thiamine biosynthesis lipoprotein
MKVLRRMQPWLGTFVEIGVEADDNAGAALSALSAASAVSAVSAVSAAFAAIADVHRLLSFQDPDSDVSRLNRANGDPVELDASSVRVLGLARAIMRASAGLFDCTVGGSLERLGALPVHDRAAALEHGDADDIAILSRRCVRLRRPVHVTLDGIAKGYAVDRAVSSLRAHGVRSGWVNAGGDLRVIGPTAVPLIVRDGDSYRALGRISNCAAATSVTSAQADERFPSRIVSTCAWPVNDGCWTVLAGRAWRADALTKVAALLPASRRAATIERLGGTVLTMPSPHA